MVTVRVIRSMAYCYYTTHIDYAWLRLLLREQAISESDEWYTGHNT